MIREVLRGAYDTHVHSAPDLVERRLTDLELARRAREQGLAGLVIKNHHFETASRALIARREVPGVTVLGGITLNETVGGLNPHAVEACLKLGGKTVWMPTVDAQNHRDKTGQKGGISILDEGGRLKETVGEILDLVKEWEAVLATGHLSLEETLVLVREARTLGLEKLVYTHPEFWITRTPLEIQKELTRQGVFMERCYYSCTLKDHHRVTLQELALQIREVGPATTILASDLGQKDNPPPPEGLELMLQGLLQKGVTEEDLETMVKENPKKLLI